MANLLHIDGSRGEGGGQVLRTSLSLSALTGRPFHLSHIRANRPKPGLRPQHLTAVQAVAAICNARLEGADLNSTSLTFTPRLPPIAGNYFFNVADVAPHGSAGAITLIFQALLWPLLFADGPSHLTLTGGTHVPFSPSFHYLNHVVLPCYAQMGARIESNLQRWGWMPVGEGQMTAVIQPVNQLQAPHLSRPKQEQIEGIAAVTKLPSHIPQRMADQANKQLRKARLKANVQASHEKGNRSGAGIFLWATNGGAGCLGRKGVPAERVADTAVEALLSFLQSGAQVDLHLADQLLIPLALAAGTTTYTTPRLTRHTLTNAALLRQWLPVSIHIDGELDQAAEITVAGLNFQLAPPTQP